MSNNSNSANIITANSFIKNLAGVFSKYMGWGLY